MRVNHRDLVVAVLCSLLIAAGASAQDAGAPPGAPAGGSAQQDRVTLRRLARQVQRVDRETEATMTLAMEQARRNDGAAAPETKAKLLSLRDERDRLFSRMLIISMRHGWKIPAVDESAATASRRRDVEDSIFGSVDVLVRRRFAAEAIRIAEVVRLPVVSLASMSE